MCAGDTEPGLWDPPFSNMGKALGWTVISKKYPNLACLCSSFRKHPRTGKESYLSLWNGDLKLFCQREMLASFSSRTAEMHSRYWLLPPGRRDLVPVSVLVSDPLSFHRTSSDSFLWAQTAMKPSYGFW